MFEDLYDSASLIFSHWWPRAHGEITAVDIEEVRQARDRDTIRLAVTYKFSMGTDGPYTGESFWKPLFSTGERVAAARDQLRIGQTVLVRYRPDDPSVNRLDHEVWKDL